MGSIIQAHCDCGYQREILLGGGMMNFTTYCNFPAYCSKCKGLFEANLFKKELECPDCENNDALPYDDDSLCKQKSKPVFDWNVQDEIGKYLELTDGKYLCPKCSQYTMSFRHVGCWD